MKRGIVRMVILWVAVGSAVAADPARFDSAEVGAMPAGWTAAMTGAGAGKWAVAADDSAPSKPGVLKQSAEVPGPSFPLCIKDQPELQDGFVEVKLKPVSGKGDQGAGVVWRFADTNNYYVCRANALEHNVVLYKVEHGKRKSLEIVGRTGGYGVDTRVAPEAWHTLRVEFSGTVHTVFFNGQKLFAVNDATFTRPGKTGLWTKGDSVMMFDDFQCGSASEPASQKNK